MAGAYYDKDGDILLFGSQGWKEEAEAVIKDVRDHVKDIYIAKNLKSKDSNIFLNVTTVEDNKLTIELSGQGFRVVGAQDHETVDDVEESEIEHFETPYSLLAKVSPGYRQSFGQCLADKLKNLEQM